MVVIGVVGVVVVTAGVLEDAVVDAVVVVPSVVDEITEAGIPVTVFNGVGDEVGTVAASVGVELIVVGEAVLVGALKGVVGLVINDDISSLMAFGSVIALNG